MTRIIEELKEEHKVILDVLTKVNSLGIETAEGQDLLINAKRKLLAHLMKEDEELYAVLRKEVEKLEELKRILNSFANDMEGISQVAFDFFAKYEDGGSGFEFGKDFSELISSLSMRILKEEKVLYAKYDEIMEK